MKDLLGKTIKIGDSVIWGAKRQGYGMKLAKVTGTTDKQHWISVEDTGRSHRCYPDSLVVVTQQLEHNSSQEIL